MTSVFVDFCVLGWYNVIKIDNEVYFVKISEINEIEYNYIFEIDNLKKALDICQTLYDEMKNGKYKIPGDVYQEIQKYNEDFISICNILINRVDIKSLDDYDNAIKSLIIINSKTRKLIYNIKGKKLKTYQIELHRMIYKINTYIPFSMTRLERFFNNHITMIVIIAGFGFFTSIFFAAELSNDIYVLAISSICVALYLIFYVIFCKKIEKAFSLDKINRTIYKNTYTHSANKKLTKEELNSIIDIVKIIK